MSQLDQRIGWTLITLSGAVICLSIAHVVHMHFEVRIDFSLPYVIVGLVPAGLAGYAHFWPTRHWRVTASVQLMAIAWALVLRRWMLQADPHLDTIWDAATAPGKLMMTALPLAFGLCLSFAACCWIPDNETMKATP